MRDRAAGRETAAGYIGTRLVMRYALFYCHQRPVKTGGRFS